MSLAKTLRQAAATLIAEADKLEAPAEKPVNEEFPFGKLPDGTEAPAPSYDKCAALWKAAEKEGLFDWSKFLPGIQQGVLAHGQKSDWRGFEDAVIALGKSDWGQWWLSNDKNAHGLHYTYQQKFLGYYVWPKHKPANPYQPVDLDQGFYRVQ